MLRRDVAAARTTLAATRRAAGRRGARRRRCRRRCGCSSARWRRPRRRSGRSRSPCRRRRGEQGHVSAAGVVLAAMAVGTVAGSLLAGRDAGAMAPQWRVVGAGGCRWPAGSRSRPPRPGSSSCWARRCSSRARRSARCSRALYVLADRLAPPGSGTRTFAWLVTANNGGLALGAAAAGALDGPLRRRRGAVVRRRLRARRRRSGDRGGTYVRTRTRTPVRCPNIVEYLPTKPFYKASGDRDNRGRGHEPLEELRRLCRRGADTSRA